MPRFYLDRFADAGGRVQQVWLPGDRQHPVSISSASVIKDFYNINIGTQQEPDLSDFWEKQFAEVETTAAEAFEAVVDDLVWPPSPEHRSAIALWAALQQLRSPAVRNQQQDHVASIIRMQTAVNGIEYLRRVMAKGLGREVGEAELEAEWEDLTKPGGPKIDLWGKRAYTTSAGPHRAHRSDVRWLCGGRCIAFAAVRYLTSDTPVALLAHPDEDPMMGVGSGHCRGLSGTILPPCRSIHRATRARQIPTSRGRRLSPARQFPHRE